MRLFRAKDICLTQNRHSRLTNRDEGDAPRFAVRVARRPGPVERLRHEVRDVDSA